MRASVGRNLGRFVQGCRDLGPRRRADSSALRAAQGKSRVTQPRDVSPNLSDEAREPASQAGGALVAGTGEQQAWPTQASGAMLAERTYGWWFGSRESGRAVCAMQTAPDLA